MKLADKIKQHKGPHPFFTFEFFPPRTDQGFENLVPRICRLAELDPLAISITWGAGGSTKERTLELAGVTQEQNGLDTVMHLTCTNMKVGMVDEALAAAKERGIESILALRGDPPRGQEEWTPIDPRFQHGIDLVKYIRSSPYAQTFSVGVAAYPDGHTERLNDEDTEIGFLKQSVDAGADFIITQLFYDVDNFVRWVKKVREAGISVPIIPSVMPIQTYATFIRLTKLCGSRVPESIMTALEPIKSDDRLVKDYGVELAVEMVRRITTEAGIPGIHLCTLNLEKSVTRVLEILKWTPAHAAAAASAQPSITGHNSLIADGPASTVVHPPPQLDAADLVLTPGAATDKATHGLKDIPAVGAPAGSGELNNAASWDDFPNGRFGDVKSPAYGELGPWGSFGQAYTNALSSTSAGNPTTLDELTKIFVDYLEGKIPTTPFSPTALSPESKIILPELRELTARGWWTVGSQPAVDGVSSADEVVGWGPRAGYVFQKCFVEFFCEEADVEQVSRAVEANGYGWVDWFAGNYQGDLRGNVPEGGRNAVTWGVFPGQEIVQTTIIERESFCSWKEEAFDIWSDWAGFYRPGSEERKLLENVRDTRWLVSIVHHDYKDPDALWKFLRGVGTEDVC
ncbi:methylenetetrahydrofolate reduct [Schizophyllum commune H4-8]|uniref:MTHFR SAM-binding regulatory domain-containing protein n=1 Tax=Schizophyllum commune (strain H4-8 / FGSC 9210) TaxID=578458 RepID=D8PVA5_SCHCM|nr:methylenetetrahydrofolate reduct [Schizophyllum commune H4-8]KAI5900434.1 methylenetetrahydrofolate reduct [Schizophyllum commune H4-8]